MRSISILLVLLVGTPAIGQECANGQCARKVATVAKAPVVVATGATKRTVQTVRKFRIFSRFRGCR